MPARLLDKRGTHPYKTAGLVLVIVAVGVLALTYGLFRGNFTSKTPLTMTSPRAGLVLEPCSKVTYNGVEIGRVARLDETGDGATPNGSIAPYNHLGLGQPILIEYVWGRQIGENTINP